MTREPKRARVRISGRVQGVFFRAETRERAEALGLGGWVRNAPDGSVEVVLEGPGERIESLLAWARRGPVSATVDAVEVEWEDPLGESEFGVR